MSNNGITAHIRGGREARCQTGRSHQDLEPAPASHYFCLPPSFVMLFDSFLKVLPAASPHQIFARGSDRSGGGLPLSEPQRMSVVPKPS